MCMYKVQYLIKDGEQKIKHSRYYNATNESIAKEMLKETWREGSLSGYSQPEVVKVVELNISQETKS